MWLNEATPDGAVAEAPTGALRARLRRREDADVTQPAAALTCTSCRGSLLPVVYGYPSSQMWQAQERGELMLGGCTREPAQARFRCPECYDPWNEEASTVDADQRLPAPPATGPGPAACSDCGAAILAGELVLIRRDVDGVRTYAHRDTCRLTTNNG
jgi:hypothetical protein